MGIFSRKESPVLQKGYDEAYNHSLQSILKEGNHQYEDALDSWRHTLEGINICLRSVDTYSLKSSHDKSILTNIRDIERQCHDRIRYLEHKTGNIPQNPYGTGSSSTSVVAATVKKSSGGAVNRVAVGSKTNLASPSQPRKSKDLSRAASPSATSSPVATSSPKSRSQPALPKGYAFARRDQPSAAQGHTAAQHVWGRKSISPKIDDGLWSGFDGVQRQDSGASHKRSSSYAVPSKLEPSPLLQSAQAKVQGKAPPRQQQRPAAARYVITRSTPQLNRSQSPRPQQQPASAPPSRQDRAGNNDRAPRRAASPERSPSPEIDDWDKAALEKLKGLRGVDENAAKQVLAEVVLKGDPVHWDDVAGLEKAKSSLKETVVYPFLRPDLFSGLREPALGMLLFGPPGTGKTMLARAVATESNSTFFSISASSLTSKYMGESEKLVRALFQMAKALAPSIIFVDEIDSILTQRSDSGEHEASRRIKTEFLVQWSDLQAAASNESRRVLVLGATNLPWAIDEAARRRFVRRQYIPLPEDETRRAHLLKLLMHQKHALVPADVETLVGKTRGYSGSDLTALAKDAAMGPLRSLGDALLTTDPDSIRPMDLGDFVESMRTIRASVSPSGLREFEQWAELYGSSGA